MKSKKGKKLKLLKGEKIMYVIIVLLVIAVPVVNVFSKALVSETNIKLEDYKTKITNQSQVNESLDMQINELASLQNIQNIAEIYGLTYNNNNIKVIEGEN